MSKICLSYDCPKVKEFITPENGAFDCSLCQKKVYDFTHMNEQEFSKEISQITSQNLCGIYRYDQVDNSSTLRWHNKLKVYYSNLKSTNPQAFRTIFIGITLFALSSCRLGREPHIVGQLAKRYPTDKTIIEREAIPVNEASPYLNED